MRALKIEKLPNGHKKLYIPQGKPKANDEDYVFGIDVIKQNLEDRLSIIQGEYYLDTTLGTPLIRNKQVTDLAIQSTILSTIGVREIIDFYSTLSPSRKYSAKIIILTESNQTLELEI